MVECGKVLSRSGIALFLLLPGCLTCLNPLPEPYCERVEQVQAIHDDCRAGVYVFIVNGNDPFCIANVIGLRDYLVKLGFTRVYYGEICHEGWMAEEIRTLRRDRPEARFVVVGFEYGADAARNIAMAATETGAELDLLLYLEPKGLSYNCPVAETGIRRVVSIETDNWLTKSEGMEGAEVFRVARSTRYGVPTHPVVLELLTEELSHLAAMVPLMDDRLLPPPSLLDEPAPTPRPIREELHEPTDEWDFLKLVSRRTERTSRELPKTPDQD